MTPIPGLRQLAWVLAGSAVLKLSLIAVVGDIPLVGDEASYLDAGRAVAAGRGVHYSVDLWNELTQPPLYPWFLGGIFALGGDPTAVRIVQALLSTATAGFVFVAARRLFGARAALVASAITAFYPTLVAFTHYFWNETLFIFLWTGAFCLLLDRRGACARPAALALAGAALGAATLTRSFVLYLVPALVLWIGWSTRSVPATLVRGAVLVVSFAAVLAPHAIGVQREYGPGILVNDTSIAWHRNYNLFDPFNADWGFRGRLEKINEAGIPRYRARGLNPAESSREERRRAIEFAWERPEVVARHTGMRLLEFLNPTSFVIRHLRLGVYTPPAWLREGIVWLEVAAYVALAGVGVLGFVAMPPSAGRALLLVLVFGTVALHALGAGMSRYRLPLVPLLAISAGAFLVDSRWASRLREPRRMLTAAAILVALVLAWSVHAPKIWGDGSLPEAASLTGDNP